MKLIWRYIAYNHFAFKFHRFDDGLSSLLNAHLVFFIHLLKKQTLLINILFYLRKKNPPKMFNLRLTWQYDRIDLVVFTQYPEKQLGQVMRKYELSEWFSRSPNGQRCVVFFSYNIQIINLIKINENRIVSSLLFAI